jgi:hypothetical protein
MLGQQFSSEVGNGVRSQSLSTGAKALMVQKLSGSHARRDPILSQSKDVSAHLTRTL